MATTTHTYVKVRAGCQRCGHGPDDHRLDDALAPGPCDPGAKFRCVDANCECADYVSPVACPDCDTNLTRVKGRRQGARLWWCWKCLEHKRPGRGDK